MLEISKIHSMPLYEQIYRQMKDQIMAGIFASGDRLPATRKMAEEYQVSRNTVIAAYEQLRVEGFVTSVTGSGYYVENIQQDIRQEVPAVEWVRNRPDFPEEEIRYDFQYGNLDYSCYRNRAWRRCILNAFDGMAVKQRLRYGQMQGSEELRRALSQYLHRSRGVRCDPDQILITGGHQQSLEYICGLFSPVQWKFAMEEPGYDGTRTVFVRNGYSPVPVRLEQDGIALEPLKELSGTLLYITPSHQFPMGCVLPVCKRMAILNWAAETDSYVIEDDYDSELRYNTMPIPSLQSLDRGGRTIYMGTFSKSISPELRMAYIVLPRRLLPVLRERYGLSGGAVSTFLQQAMAAFISGGEYERHLDSLRTHFRKKNTILMDCLEKGIADKGQIIGAHAGMHLILSLKTDMTEAELIQAFLRQGIRLYPVSCYWMDRRRCPAGQLLLGYGEIPVEDLRQATETLLKTLHSL